MSNRKTIQLIASFTNAELDEFRKFMECRAFNTRKASLVLFDIIHSRIKQKNTDLSREALGREMYPEEEKSEFDPKIRKLLSTMQRTAEDFLCWRRLATHPQERNFLLLSELNDRGLDKSFYAFLNQMEKKKADKIQDENHFYHNYRLSVIVGDFLGKGAPRANQPEQLKSLLEILETWNHYSQFTQLKYQAILSNLNFNLWLTDQEPITWPEPLNVLKEGLPLPVPTEFKFSPAEDLYHQLIQLTNQPKNWNPGVFSRLIEDLKSHSDTKSLSGEDEFYIFGITLNLFIRALYNKDFPDKFRNLSAAEHKAFRLDLAELYDVGLTKGYLLSNGKIPAHTYKNIIELNLRLGRLGKAYDLLEKYGEKIWFRYKRGQLKQGEDVYNFCKGNCLVHSKQYSKALKILSVLKFDDVPFDLGLRILKLKIGIATRQMASAKSLHKAFKQYLDDKAGKNQLPEELSEYYRNRLEELNKLMKAGNTSQLERLKNQIEQSEDYFDDREWILKVIEERLEEN